MKVADNARSSTYVKRKSPSKAKNSVGTREK